MIYERLPIIKNVTQFLNQPSYILHNVMYMKLKIASTSIIGRALHYWDIWTDGDGREINRSYIVPMRQEALLCKSP